MVIEWADTNEESPTGIAYMLRGDVHVVEHVACVEQKPGTTQIGYFVWSWGWRRNQVLSRLDQLVGR